VGEEAPLFCRERRRLSAAEERGLKAAFLAMFFTFDF
jgi:hypothetical protein